MRANVSFLSLVYGNWRYIRSCAFLGSPGEGTGNENFCTMRTGTYNVFVETCTCSSKDGCNTATPLLPCYSCLLPLSGILAFFILHNRLLPSWWSVQCLCVETTTDTYKLCFRNVEDLSIDTRLFWIHPSIFSCGQSSQLNELLLCLPCVCLSN